MAGVEFNADNRIAAGLFTCVHRISEDRVRKVPRNEEPDHIQAVHNEANIYCLLGRNKRIAKCTSTGLTVDYVDLEWAENGNLEDYLRKHQSSITSGFRSRIGRQMIEAVQYIHRRGVIHSDLALRQYLLDDKYDARLSDFASSSYGQHQALGMENASHYLPRDPEEPNTIQSDIFALGSTLYELMEGRAPYGEKTDDEILSLFQNEKFPCTNEIPYGDVILSCWKKTFRSADEVLRAFDKDTLKQSSTAPKLLRPESFYSQARLMNAVNL